MDSFNLKKLSSILGLSISTVSKALRDSHEISAHTKERVIQVAKEYNYQPNIYASSLRRSKSKTMAVIVPEIANNFFISAIDGIHKVAESNSYHVLIYLSHESAIYEKELINSLANGRVDGVLISLSRDTTELSHLKSLIEKNIPIVMFDRVNDSIKCSSVSTNDYESAYTATEHLINAGCKKIAHCRIINAPSIGVNRFNGYKDCLIKNNLRFNSRQLIDCTDNYNEDYQKIKSFLKSKNRPDGLFTAIESSALIAYEVCVELHIHIPSDLKIVTFSNLRTAALLNPPLTTVTQPAFEIGEKAASELIKAIEKPRFYRPEKSVIKSKLFIRASTNLK